MNIYINCYFIESVCIECEWTACRNWWGSCVAREKDRENVSVRQRTSSESRGSRWWSAETCWRTSVVSFKPEMTNVISLSVWYFKCTLIHDCHDIANARRSITNMTIAALISPLVIWKEAMQMDECRKPWTPWMCMTISSKT